MYINLTFCFYYTQNASGVDSITFRQHIEQHPATYADWSTGEWQQQTTGKEENLKSPYLSKEFQQAKEDGLVPANLGRDGQNTLGGECVVCFNDCVDLGTTIKYFI